MSKTLKALFFAVVVTFASFSAGAEEYATEDYVQQQLDPIHGDIQELHTNIEDSDNWHNSQNDKQQVQIDDLYQKEKDNWDDQQRKHAESQQGINKAQGTADAAYDESQDAKREAILAQGTADNASSKADVNSDRINGLAQETFENGEKADNARASANRAQKSADKAGTDAGKAQSSADKAQTTANQANDSANTANDGVASLNGQVGDLKVTTGDHNKRITILEGAQKGMEGDIAQNKEDVASAKADAAQSQVDANSALRQADQANYNSEAAVDQSVYASVTADQANQKADVARVQSDKAVEASQVNAQDIKGLGEGVKQANATAKAATKTAVDESKAYTDSRLNGVGNEIRSVRKEARSGIAGVAAMANIPQVADKDLTIGVGAGNFKDTTAVAVGAILKTSKESAMKLSVSSDGHDQTYGVGFSTGF